MKNPVQVKLNEEEELSTRKSEKYKRKLGWTFKKKST
jgi:hypothetical protein